MLVQNTGNFIRHFGSIRLLPGANEIDNSLQSELEKELKNPLNKHLVDIKEIVIPDKKGGGVDSITDLPANDAIQMVQDTFDKALLEKFLADENSKGSKIRVSVVKAIEEQLETQFNPSADNIVDPDE